MISSMSQMFSKYPLVLNAQCCLALSTMDSVASALLDSEWTEGKLTFLGVFVLSLPNFQPQISSWVEVALQCSTNSYGGSYILTKIYPGRSPPNHPSFCQSLLIQKALAFERRIKDIPSSAVCSGFAQAPHQSESSHLSWWTAWHTYAHTLLMQPGTLREGG